MPSRTTMPADQRRQTASLEARARHLERVFARLFSEDCPEGHRQFFFLSLAEALTEINVDDADRRVTECPSTQVKKAAPMKPAPLPTAASKPKARSRSAVPA